MDSEELPGAMFSPYGLSADRATLMSPIQSSSPSTAPKSSALSIPHGSRGYATMVPPL